MNVHFSVENLALVAPQVLFLILGMNQVDYRWLGRLVISSLLVLLGATSLVTLSMDLIPQERDFFLLGLGTIWALFPAVAFSSGEGERPRVLNICVASQQLFLRTFFIYWATHRLVAGQETQDISLALVIIGGFASIASYFFLNRKAWGLTLKGVLTLFLMALAITKPGLEASLLFGWVALIWAASIVGQVSNNQTLSRLELGGFGGGVFISSLALVFYTAGMSEILKLAWVAVIFFNGASAWALELPESEEEKKLISWGGLLVHVSMFLLFLPKFF